MQCCMKNPYPNCVIQDHELYCISEGYGNFYRYNMLFRPTYGTLQSKASKEGTICTFLYRASFFQSLEDTMK